MSGRNPLSRSQRETWVTMGRYSRPISTVHGGPERAVRVELLNAAGEARGEDRVRLAHEPRVAQDSDQLVGGQLAVLVAAGIERGVNDRGAAG